MRYKWDMKEIYKPDYHNMKAGLLINFILSERDFYRFICSVIYNHTNVQNRWKQSEFP